MKMSAEGGEETLKCDGDGYFDLDAMRPYSTVWVSTKREVRSRRNVQHECEIKKDVMPSKAFNNLHSLLGTTETFASTENSEEDLCKSHMQPSSTKSDHTPLNTYKLFDKCETVSLKKISDKIIGSMCKSESILAVKEEELSDKLADTSSGSIVSERISREKTGSEKFEFSQEQFDETDHSSSQEQKTTEGNCQSAFSELLIKEEVQLSRGNKLPSVAAADLCCGEPIDDPSKTCRMLTDKGKLVTELNITALKLKDQNGREFPVTIKYIWETNTSEVLNALDNIYPSSQSFLSMIDSLSAIGHGPNQSTDEKQSEIKHDDVWKTKSKSCFKSCNSSATTPKQTACDGNEANIPSGKASAPKRGVEINDGMKSRSTRSKVSIVNPFQDRKTSDNDMQERNLYRLGELKIPNEARVQSKLNIPLKRTFGDKQARIVMKKKGNSSDEIKLPTSARSRPSTFNRRDFGRLANRPPSAPLREGPTRIPQRIGDPSDKSITTFGKKQFGNKCFSPHTPSSGKLWK